MSTDHSNTVVLRPLVLSSTRILEVTPHGRWEGYARLLRTTAPLGIGGSPVMIWACGSPAHTSHQPASQTAAGNSKQNPKIQATTAQVAASSAVASPAVSKRHCVACCCKFDHHQRRPRVPPHLTGNETVRRHSRLEFMILLGSQPPARMGHGSQTDSRLILLLVGQQSITQMERDDHARDSHKGGLWAS